MLLAILIGATGPAAATAEYQYQPDEYVTVSGGQAPDGRHAIATHGEGESGSDNFHVWLMQAGRPVAVLPGIDQHNNLDTAASAYTAFWAPDSHHVAVSWRVGRHLMQLYLYAVEGARVQPIALPDLVREVTGRALSQDDDVRTAVPLIEWTAPSRFVLKEFRLILTSNDDAPSLLRSLGRFARLDDNQPQQGRSFVVFAVEAECALQPRGSRLIALKPGDVTWWRSRVWDPR